MSGLSRFLPIGLFAIGYFLIGYPSPVDAAFSRAQVFGVFLVFLAWAHCACAWGALVSQRWLKSAPSLALEAAIGTALFALGISLLGAMAALGPGFKFLYLGLALAGPLFGPRPSFQKPALTREENLPFAFAALLVLLRVLQGFRLPQHGDPFIYELMAPRVWFDSGAIHVPSHLPYVGQAGLWTYLSLWGTQLLAGGPGEGLVAAQHFGQWTQAVFGYGGTALLLSFGLSFFGVSGHWKWLGIVAALCTAEIRDVSSLSKCDWGAIFWFTSGSVILLSQRTKRSYLVSGVLLGSAFVAKYTVGYTLIPVLGIFLASQTKCKDRLFPALVLLGGIAVAAAPVLLRNWIWTQNPLFPAFHTVFHSPIFGPTVAAGHSQHYEVTHSTWQFLSRFRVFLVFGGRAILHWIAFLPIFALGSAPRPWKAFWAAGMGGLILFAAHLGETGIARWAGPTLTWLGPLGVMTTLLILKQPFAKRFSLHAGIALWAATLFTSDIPLFTLTQFWSEKYESGPRGLMDHTHAEAKAWLRQNIRTGARILLLGDNELYYLSQFDVHVGIEDAATDQRLLAISEETELLGFLREKFDVVADFDTSKSRLSPLFDKLILAGKVQKPHSGPWGRIMIVHPSHVKSGP